MESLMCGFILADMLSFSVGMKKCDHPWYLDHTWYLKVTSFA